MATATPPRPSLHDMWLELEKRVVEGMPVTDLQRAEMQKSFKSGVAAMFFEMKHIGENMSEEDGTARLADLDAQLQQFFTADIFKL